MVESRHSHYISAFELRGRKRVTAQDVVDMMWSYADNNRFPSADITIQQLHKKKRRWTEEQLAEILAACDQGIASAPQSVVPSMARWKKIEYEKIRHATQVRLHRLYG